MSTPTGTPGEPDDGDRNDQTPPPAPGTPPPPPDPTQPVGYWEQQAQQPPPPPGHQPPGQQPPQQPGHPPQPPMQAPPPGYGYPPAPGAGAVYRTPDHPRATTALVLGLISVVGGLTCFLPLALGPWAWVVGRRAVREIDADPQRLGGRGQAMAGYVLGVVASVLLVLGLIGLALLLVLAFVGAGGSTSFETTRA